jgi:hypothetical protein
MRTIGAAARTGRTPARKPGRHARHAAAGRWLAVASLAGSALVVTGTATAAPKETGRTAATANADRTATARAGRTARARADRTATARADHTVTVNTVSGEYVNVRAEASATGKVVGRRKDGRHVTIVCHKVGDKVTGTYGTSRYWDMLASGGYVADAFLSTGSDKPVVPQCGRASHEPPHRALAPRIHTGFISHRSRTPGAPAAGRRPDSF